MGTLYIGNTPVAPIIGSNENTGNSEFTEKLLKGTLTKITQGNLKGITEIYPYMFIAQKDLESVDIPEGVTAINNNAFYATDFYAYSTSTSEITEQSYSTKKNFTTVKIPSTCLVIGREAFRNCTALANIEFPNGCNVKYIGSGAFARTACKSLVFNNLEKIGGSTLNGAFEEMKFLKNIDFTGSTFQKIPELLFRYCDKLATVVLPSTLKIIKGYAFYYCSQLKSISLYKGFEKFSGPGIFEGSGVTTINFTGTRAEMKTILSNSYSDWDARFRGKFVCSDGNLVKNSSGSWVNG